jgi:sporadic carbohydrate cluster protein (TIGR04323 family)
MNCISYVNNCTEYTRGIPIHLQRLMMANYAQENQLLVQFEQLEIEVMQHLPTLLHIIEVDQAPVILLFSIYALPADAALRAVITKAALQHGCTLHFANESLSMRDAGSRDTLERMLTFSRVPS